MEYSFSLSIQVGRIQKKKTIVKEMTTLANFKGKLYSFVIYINFILKFGCKDNTWLILHIKELSSEILICEWGVAS
jgi:hypothetical protein